MCDLIDLRGDGFDGDEHAARRELVIEELEKVKETLCKSEECK